MGLSDLWDDVVDTVSDGVDAVVDAAESVADEVVDATTSVADGVGDVADAIGDAAGEVGGVVADGVDSVLTAVDDTVLDALDTASLGLVDIDWDNGRLTTHVGVRGVAGYGFGIGGGEFDASVSTGGYTAGVHAGDRGTGVSASGGVDETGLPFLDLDVGVDGDGGAQVDVRAQGYLPVPTGGLAGGEAEAHVHERADGIDVSASATGRYITAAGADVAAGAHMSYSEGPDGHELRTGVHAEAGVVGGPHVYGSADYVTGRQGSTTYEGIELAGGVRGDGYDAGGSVGVRSVDGPDGHSTVVDVDGHATVEGVGTIAGGATVTIGEQGTDIDGHLAVEFEEPDWGTADELPDGGFAESDDPSDGDPYQAYELALEATDQVEGLE